MYEYLTNQYSGRKIEQAAKQNIHFMWLSGMSYPDHNTINRFRSERLKGVLKEVFREVVLLLVEQRTITLKEVYLDGTRIEANANRYTFVWSRDAGEETPDDRDYLLSRPVVGIVGDPLGGGESEGRA